MANEFLTAEQIAEIEAREKAASPGPWQVMGKHDHIIGNRFDVAERNKESHCQWTHNTTAKNADFISACRSDIPRLLADRRALLALLAYPAVREVLCEIMAEHASEVRVATGEECDCSQCVAFKGLCAALPTEVPR